MSTSDDRLGKYIKDAAENIGLEASESEKLFSEILLRTEERRKIMSISKGKKIGLLMAAALAVGGITAIAGSGIASLSSSTYLNEAFETATKTAIEAEKSLGSTPDYVEAFNNGYSFERGFVTFVDMADEDGVNMGAYPEAIFDYAGEGQPVSLNVSAVPEILSAQWEAQGIDSKKDVYEYNGTDLYTAEERYIFLPPDGQPTKEESELEAEGELFISYGTDEREEKLFKSVAWKKEGLSYLLSTYDEDLDIDELLEMAREVIEIPSP